MLQGCTRYQPRRKFQRRLLDTTFITSPPVPSPHTLRHRSCLFKCNFFNYPSLRRYKFNSCCFFAASRSTSLWRHAVEHGKIITAHCLCVVLHADKHLFVCPIVRHKMIFLWLYKVIWEFRTEISRQQKSADSIKTFIVFRILSRFGKLKGISASWIYSMHAQTTQSWSKSNQGIQNLT